MQPFSAARFRRQRPMLWPSGGTMQPAEGATGFQKKEQVGWSLDSHPIHTARGEKRSVSRFTTQIQSAGGDRRSTLRRPRVMFGVPYGGFPGTRETGFRQLSGQ